MVFLPLLHAPNRSRERPKFDSATPRAVTGALTPLDVQAWLNAKLEEGLAPRTVQYIHATLRDALNAAVRWGVVGRNVATLVDPVIVAARTGPGGLERASRRQRTPPIEGVHRVPRSGHRGSSCAEFAGQGVAAGPPAGPAATS